MSWRDIGTAITALTKTGKSVEVGKCGPHRAPGEDYFAHVSYYAGGIERTTYGATPYTALSRLFSEKKK